MCMSRNTCYSIFGKMELANLEDRVDLLVQNTARRDSNEDIIEIENTNNKKWMKYFTYIYVHKIKGSC